MGPFRSVFSLALVLVFTTPINSVKTYVYFSDFSTCGNTNSVGRGDIVQIEAKRSSTGGSTAFTSCSLLFRAELPEDKLCVKISNLTFSSTKLQYQYFDSLDPTQPGISPAETFDSANAANTPLEICSNQYEISMKLHQLTSGATIGEVDLLITVFNMQGTQRIAYFDEDCSTTFKLRDSTIFVQNTNAAGAMAKKSVCHLFFEYIGTNPNKTICLQYMKLRDECDYSLKILDGPQGGFTQAQTYTCTQTQPQTWCSTKTFVQFELENTGSTGLPENTFTIEVKDGTSDKFPKNPTKDADVADISPNLSTGFTELPTENTGLETWQIALIAIGVIVGVAVVVAVAVVCVKKSQGYSPPRDQHQAQSL